MLPPTLVPPAFDAGSVWLVGAGPGLGLAIAQRRRQIEAIDVGPKKGRDATIRTTRGKIEIGLPWRRDRRRK